MSAPPPHDPPLASPGGGSPLLAAAVLAAALALGGLLRHQAAHPHVAPAPSASASARAARPVVLPALAGPAQVTLTGGALVLPPIGATTSRPVVLVWGGAGTPAAEPCALVARAAASHPFVVCPPALALAPGAPSSEALQPLRAALAELRARFGLHVAPGAVVVVGFGAGARDAVAAMRSSPQFFSRLGLVHGGHESWVGGIPTHFGRGGRRVLFVCARERCAAAAEAAEARTRATLALPRVELLPGDPAPLGAETEAALRKHWAWLAAE